VELLNAIYVNALPSRVARAIREGQPIAAGLPSSDLRSTFEPVANRYTKLTVRQDRFADDDPNYEVNKTGWPQLLSNLKSFIETGQVMNYHTAD
jgi:hypothetical protein